MFSAGDEIGVPCKVEQGPFSGEKLITFETVNGPVSGFVNESELRQAESGWIVRCTVKEAYPDSLEVWVVGSFFTTNGLASVRPDVAIAA